MSFSNPVALLLLPVLLVALAFIGWPRLAYRRRRDSVSLVIRSVLVTLLVLGLAGIQMTLAADKLAVVFLIDASDSVSPALQSQAVEYVRTAADAMGPQDYAAVVVFGADALVEIPITQQLELVQIGSNPVRLNTDLAEAIRLGLALFPADTAKRMVVLSDGRQTVGDAVEVARLAAATDVQIDYVYLGVEGQDQQALGPEMMISDVHVPSTVNEGETFKLTVTLEANRRNSAAELRVLSAGQVIARREVELQPGQTNVIFEVQAPTAGPLDLSVVLEPRSADGFYQNNQLAAFTQVTGPPRVLLITSEAREVEALSAALEESGLVIDERGPNELPIGLAPLSRYNSSVLANVAATEMSARRLDYLQAYVRDLGGGLLVLAGPNSYGVGGYFKTPLEETLPVEMRIKDRERVPRLTMLFVIDRSGSMQMSSTGGVTNLELAKEATIRSFDLLDYEDRVGVMSFDMSAYYVLPIQTVETDANREMMRMQVGTLRPGGGTNIRQAILHADEQLRGDPSDLKHIILLTDGGADQTGIVAAVDRMYENYGITTSVVAVGPTVDNENFLRDLADAGRGQFHLATDISTIPAIFTSETLLATRAYISEEEFFPTLAMRHPILSGIDSLPSLKGYIATTAKETASVILRGPFEDPILAAWQYGLGKAVAFTSDASSRWGANWVTWPGYAAFWSQAVRWTITEDTANQVEARVTERGEQAYLTVDVRDTEGDYLNGLQLEAAVISAQLDALTLRLQQVAPGRYEAAFTPQREGAYFITIAGSSPADAAVFQPQSITHTTGWVLSYSAEYRLDVMGDQGDESELLLAQIAAVTGGESLRDSPDRAFLHNLNQERASQPIWPYLVLAGLLLLPFDIAMRRLVITARDVEVLRATVARWMGSGDMAAEGQTSGRMGRLMDAKDRARSVLPNDSPSQTGERPAWNELPRPAVPGTTRRAEKPLPSRSAQSPAPPAEGTLASRLLKSRRESQDDDRPEH